MEYHGISITGEGSTSGFRPKPEQCPTIEGDLSPELWIVRKK